MSRLDFYSKHYTDLFAPLLSLMRHGVAVDLDRAARMRAELLAECERIQADLSDIAGVHDCACGHRDSDHLEKAAPVVLTKTGKPKKRQPKPTYTCRFCYGADGVWCRDFEPLGQPLHAKKDLSSDRVTKFLYDTLGFPKQRNRGEESPTGNEIAVRRLTIKAKKWLDEGHVRVPKDAARWKRDPAEAIRACQLILEHREKFKTAGFLDEAKIDEDGRLRCQYRFTTETGRLASRKNPYGTGANLQNIHRGVRSCFIPNDGCLFLEGDLSQAESRVVYALTGDPGLIEKARSKPWEYDAHTHNAALIFGVPLKEVTKEQRYLGKRGVHSGHYGMHGKRLSEALLLDGFTRTPDECQAMIDAYLNACSAIRTWQRAVRKRLMRDGQLVNSWGRVLSFKGERLNDDTYRRGYAFVPQSEIGDLMNQWGLVPMWRWLREGRMRSRINLQVHDALVISVTPDEAYDVACAMQGFLERPRTYEGVELVVPVEFKLGTRWGCGVCEGCRGKTKCRAIADFKRLPDRAAFNEVVRSLTRQQEKEAA